MTVRAVGADGCRAGWVAAIVSGDDQLRFQLFADVDELARWRDDEAPGAPVGLDVPMGLTQSGGLRPCDLAARALLGGMASSVFAPAGRYLLPAATYTEVQLLVTRRRATAPETPGLSAQSAGIIPKVREVDAFLRANPDAHEWLIEVHPELSFARWAGEPLLGKRSPAGATARLRLVRERFPGIEDQLAQLPYAASKVGMDDALDACAAAWSAERWSRGEAEVLGGHLDGRGLPMRMVI